MSLEGGSPPPFPFFGLYEYGFLQGSCQRGRFNESRMAHFLSAYRLDAIRRGKAFAV